MNFKEKLFAQGLILLNAQIDAFQFQLDELSESVMNETKSTAGDKHETALSMLQLEQSRIAKHLYDAIDNKTIYCQIDLTIESDTIVSGSVVTTQRGCFFVSIALPKIQFEQKIIIAISPKSPLGEKLMGKKINDIIEVNSIEHHIEKIE
jgi:hypothetical protein